MLIDLLVLVIVVGLLFYVLSLLPLPQPWKNIATILLVLIVVLWLLGMVGYLGPAWPVYHHPR
jgi:hypothetical protein